MNKKYRIREKTNSQGRKNYNYNFKDFLNFTQRQFNEILKKNLKIPIKTLEL